MQIKWATFINVPFQQRVEVMSVAFYITYVLLGQWISLYIMYKILTSGLLWLKSILIAYLVFCYFDRHCGENGGRGYGSSWVRKWPVWKYATNYFPVKLVKTVDLPPNRNYILAIFPHGVVSTGGFCNFANDHSQWLELFPGIRPKLTTLNFHLQFPIFRELILSLGACTSSYGCLHRLLIQSNDAADPSNADGFTSNAPVLIVGGAQEAIYSRPGNYTLHLKNRKGFVRAALLHGAPLVPVFSFGEVELYDQAESVQGSRLRRFQEGFKKYTGISPCLINGRGFLQHNFGIIPRRRPITTIVGAPIEVAMNANPNQTDIDKLHHLFCEELKNLFESHKAKYVANHEKAKLVFE